MTTHGRLLARFCTTVLMVLALFPRPAVGISLTLRDVADPVPPGGTLTYLIKVNSEVNGGDGGTEVFCFNPLPECMTFPATCSIGSVACVGNSFTGYVCENALNDGADCGVGDPPVPDLTLCVPRNTGICDGGVNTGFPCSSNAECPGETFVCVHASNEGSFCGTGYPPQPEPGYCLANPTGICSAGPNFGLPCTAPHGEPTDECPPGEGGPAPESTVVTLPIPPQTTLISADNNGTSDGTAITWTVPFEPCAGTNGQSGAPPCPVLTASLMVDSATPIGSVIDSRVNGITVPDGQVAASRQETIVGNFKLSRFHLFYPNRRNRDRFTCGTRLTLNPGATVDLANELFRIQVDSAGVTVLDLGLEPGQVYQTAKNAWKFRSGEPGIKRLSIREIGPSYYRLDFRAARISLVSPPQRNVVLTLVLGDDVMSQPLYLLVSNGGRGFTCHQ